jgi:outer membrane protein assembly factor BamD (BamD/ComL family)
MSITGILSNLSSFASQTAQSPQQKARQQFAQLGQDLQSGNLAAAQSDLATLQANRPQGGLTPSTTAQSGTSTAPGGSTISQDFAQLSADLQSGNLSAAQTDYTGLQQAFQTQATQAQTQTGGHPHHHHGGGGGDSSSSSSNPISQLFTELGQALQAGNLSSAQQAYSTLQQDFQQFTQSSATSGSTTAPSGSTSVSVNA